MAKNECGVEVPKAVEELAKKEGCIGGVRYVYRDGQYNGRPVASIGCKRATRFRSNSFDHCRVALDKRWVAFRSPSSAQRIPLEGISPSMYSRVGLVTRTKKIDGSEMKFRVEDEIVFIAPSNEKKAFRVQKLQFDDGEGIDSGHIEFRICYYMIIHKERRRGEWGFGQFAPMMTMEEMKLMFKKIKEKGWL